MSSQSDSKVAAAAITLLLVALPSGTALQSTALVLASVLALWLAIKQAPQLRDVALWTSHRWQTFAHIAFVLFVIGQIFSTLFNPRNGSQGAFKQAFTYLAFIGLPPLIAWCWHVQTKAKAYWEKLTLCLLLVWTGAAISQALIGWQISGVSIVVDPHYARARGFYSHPLTLAYVLLMLWPYHLRLLSLNSKQASAWIKIVCLIILIVLSASRTVQICVLLSMVWWAWSWLRGRTRTLIFATLAALCLLVIVTENPLSKRFAALVAADNPDRYSAYPDDRLAFWHAFSGMVQERPWFGHGIDLDRSYRQPYYAAIGLGDFKKQYEAHNQFLQIAAEQGYIGLACFVAWLLALYRSFPALQGADRLAFRQTFALFILGGLTQNAFQDGEVRYAMIVMLSLAGFCQLRSRFANTCPAPSPKVTQSF